jgi:CubicO group peptidase (beta-lactamase class C family)
MKKIIVFVSILFCLMLSSCLKEDDMKAPFKGFVPADISDGWIISSPSAENMDSAGLDNIFRDIYTEERNWMMKSLLVFRNGKLLAEYYPRDEADRTETDAIWSCTKQINAIITGIAIDKGYIGSPDDPISKYLPGDIEKHSDKKDILIKHLLTMKSGIAFDNGGNDNDNFKQGKVDNSIDYILNMKLIDQPGTVFSYKDSDPQLLSAIVQKATGEPLDEFGNRVLFNPLGITNYYWYRNTDGVTLGSWGILTTPRELAKVAQCILDSGRFNNQQIIPLHWLQDMLKVHVPDVERDFGFGYLWWILPSKGWFLMRGHGGQYAFILPSEKMVVVITSLPNVDDDCSLPVSYYIDIADRIAATAY